MKKALIIASISASTLGIANTAYADFIGANAEFGLLQSETSFSHGNDEFNYDDESGTYISIDVQHPIPLIPNLRIDAFNLETSGKDSSDTDSDLQVSSQDITGYYGIGLLWVGVEGGLTVRSLDIDYDDSSSQESESESFIPMLYLSAKVSIPGTSIKLAVEQKTVSSFDDVSITDQIFKIGYQPLPIIGIEAGYRIIDQEVNDVKVENSGYFVGITIDI